ncbi:MAG TPA: hypothetical protein VMI56_05345 [Reyranella sp.]|nr:hypothetical protein [Reyranella sp.]
MAQSQYEKDEYLEQDEEEAASAGRRKSLFALLIMAVLVVAGVVLVGKLRVVSKVQDCMMTHASNCNDLVEPPKPAGTGR